jgi:hypothetical protein
MVSPLRSIGRHRHGDLPSRHVFHGVAASQALNRCSTRRELCSGAISIRAVPPPALFAHYFGDPALLENYEAPGKRATAANGPGGTEIPHCCHKALFLRRRNAYM